MSFGTILFFVALFIVGRLVARYVKEQVKTQGGATATTMREAMEAMRDETAKKAATASSAVKTAAANAQRSARLQRGTKTQRDSRPQRQAVRSSDAPWDWNIELDLHSEATRSEILDAIKLRLARARGSGDSAAIARVMRAGQAALRARPTAKELRRPGPRA